MKLTIYVIVAMFITSCENSSYIISDTTIDRQQQSSVDDRPSAPPITTAKMIIANNSFIDVDIAALENTTTGQRNTSNPQSAKAITEPYPEEHEMTRAALYRYYSKVTIVDGLMVCSAKKASDLNMSERTFRYINDNVNAINETVKEAQSKGTKVHMPEITADYLRFLIE